ncbi:MAG TPA: MFS transporter [Solirubrobacter sp.]|nr:MFS transporter [Solirubrobacter sp.]
MATPDARSQSPGGGRALVLATLAFTACFFAWAMLGPLAPALQESIGLSDFATAVMVAVPVLLGSLLRVPLGVLTDHYGARRTFTALMAVTLPALVGLAFWHASLGAVLAFGLWLGLAGASFAVGIPFVSRWTAPERRGFALGVYGMGMGGTVLTALLAPRIADRWGLAAPFWVAAVVLALAGIVFAVLAREPYPVRPAGPLRLFAPLAIFRGNPRAWALTLFYFLSFGGFVALFLYLPKLLVGVHELSKSDAGARAAGFALFAVVARPAGGWLADRIGAERVLRVSFALTAALAIALAFGYRAMIPLTLACLAIGLAFGAGTGAVFKLVALWFPGHVGAVTGVVGAAGGLGGFAPPLVLGLAKTLTGGYAVGFVLLSVVAIVALAVLASLDPRRKRRWRLRPAPAV